MRTIYAVVNHLQAGQVEVAYSSKKKAYIELKKLFKTHIENDLSFYNHCSKEEAKEMRKLLNSTFNDEIVYSISNLLSSSIDYPDIEEDFYILPIDLNPER